MSSPRDKQDFIIDNLINFFYHLSGNRSMPNLFPEVFDKDTIREYNNKSKQLAYLFKIHKQNDSIDNLLNILINNLSWNEHLEEQLNKLIEPLSLIYHNGKVSKISEVGEELTFGEFNEIYKEIQKKPDNREQILAKYNISQEDFNKFKESMKSFTKMTNSIAKSISPTIDLMKVMEPIRQIIKTLPNITFIPELPMQTISPPIIYPSIEEAEARERITLIGLCPITSGTCSLPDVVVRELENKRPYAFLIFPSEHKDLEKISKKILTDNGIELITAIAEPSIGGKYCKICSLIKYCNFCIAELGELNLNVFMEIGLAFGFDKFTILTLNENYTTQDKIPFDLDSFMNIPYKTNNELAKGLKDHVKKIMKYLDLNH